MADGADVMVVQLVVEGHPVPQGTLVRNPHGGLYYPKPLKVWRKAIAVEAQRAMRGLPMIRARCTASARFYITPTKGGKSPGRLRGDLDKLVRAVFDAVTGVIIEDDELVVGLIASKVPVEAGHVERVDFSFAIVTV